MPKQQDKQLPQKKSATDYALGITSESASVGQSILEEITNSNSDYKLFCIRTKRLTLSLNLATYYHNDQSEHKLRNAILNTTSAEIIGKLTHFAMGGPATLALDAMALIGNAIQPFAKFYLEVIPEDMAKRYQLPDLSYIR